MKYNTAYVFTKYTDMLDYFNKNIEHICGARLFEDIDTYLKRVDNVRKRYAQPRPVDLMLLVRYEYDVAISRNRIICRIKCPINPMPIKGEFETHNLPDLINFIKQLGWDQGTTQTKFDLRLFE